MGSACGKGETEEQAEHILDSSDTESNVPQFYESCLADHFSITLESFVTTTSRLSVKSSPVTRGCKHVVVTRIRLELNNPQMTHLARTSSMLHMPVVKMTNTDVKFQLPEFLPLNLWCGTQTIFSFVFPDAPEDSSVTLTGKIGARPVSIQQQVRRSQEVTAEQLTEFNKQLESEIVRYEKKNPKGLQTEGGNRRGSNNSSPYTGLAYFDDSSDSDALSAAQRDRGKRSKLRRKDTPSHHNLQPSPQKEARESKLKLYRQQIDGLSLHEEEEEEEEEEEVVSHRKEEEGALPCLGDEESRDIDGLTKRPMSTAHRETTNRIDGSNKSHRLGLLTINTKSSECDHQIGQLPERMTRSFNNIRDLMDETPDTQAKFSPISLQFGTDGPCERRKKTSIVLKLSKLSCVADARSTSELLQARSSPSSCDGQDMANDADDEGENTARYRRKPKSTRTSEAPDVYRQAVDDLVDKDIEEQVVERVKGDDVSTRTEKARSVVKVDIGDEKPGKDGRSRISGSLKGSGKPCANEVKSQGQTKESVRSKQDSDDRCRRKDAQQGDVSVLSKTRKQTVRVKEVTGTASAKEKRQSPISITATYAKLDPDTVRERARKLSGASVKEISVSERQDKREVTGQCSEVTRESDEEEGAAVVEEAMRKRAMTASRADAPRRAVSGRQKKSMSLQEGQACPIALPEDKPLPSPVVEERPSPVQAFIFTKK